MATKKTTEFRLKIDGIKLPAAVQRRIAQELQRTLKSEIARIDLKGDLLDKKSYFPFKGQTMGYFGNFVKDKVRKSDN